MCESGVRIVSKLLYGREGLDVSNRLNETEKAVDSYVNVRD